MTESEKNNWQRIKDALEIAGKTDSFFYTRAVAIVQGEPDPFDFQLK